MQNHVCLLRVVNNYKLAKNKIENNGVLKQDFFINQI